MKFSEQWLRNWINPPIDARGLMNQLTMAGLEVSSIILEEAEFSGVLVGEVVAVNAHPDAQKLHCCQVNVGASDLLDIVCGANNVQVGLKVAVAMVGAVLPGNLIIKQAKLRGLISNGMLCSAKELNLEGYIQNGIMELPLDAPIGMDLSLYFQLNDHILDIELTPNRSDCLSIRGLAREIAVLNQLPFEPKTIPSAQVQIADTLDLKVSASKRCPRYVGRVIRNIQIKANTPIWMKEYLRRSGIRSIHPVVDITNFVMLELGQPMHAFDMEKLEGGILVRLAKQGETLELLDNKKIILDEDTLIIADYKCPQAIAGVMGGEQSGVVETTQHIFLESAFFDPIMTSLTARRYGLQTDSSYRFSRGVDYNLQTLAIERATHLILEIVGGEAGPLSEIIDENTLPSPVDIALNYSSIKKLLGLQIETVRVEQILTSLGMELTANDAGWMVRAPSYRFDITIEADLIEEIARIHGYQHIPAQPMQIPLVLTPKSETIISASRIAHYLIDLGYHEAINYSFIDPRISKLINPNDIPVSLENPISADMSVMRMSLWPGLLRTASYNLNRQIDRIRFFEIGNCFIPSGQNLQQVTLLGGVIAGNAYPLQWSVEPKKVDFFDVKGDIETLLMLTGRLEAFSWQISEHPALHPGQQALLLVDGAIVGYLGALHPQISQQLDFSGSVFLFEFNFDILQKSELPQFKSISKFPMIKRDIAITVAKEIPVANIKQFIQSISGDKLTEIIIFDVYQGDKIVKGEKSIALSLTFQEISRTLTDIEINGMITEILEKLEQQFQAKLRV